MSETKVITGKVRFSYAHVFKAVAIEDGQDKKFSVSLLISKTDTKTLAKIKAGIEAAKKAGAAVFGGKVPATLKTPLRDGDEEKPDNPEYAGMMFLNASTKRKPEVLDADLEEISEENMNMDEFYSGCYGRASINFYAFNKAGNKGIAAGLNNLQKLEDGEPLGAEVASARDDFGSEEDDMMN